MVPPETWRRGLPRSISLLGPQSLLRFHVAFSLSKMPVTSDGMAGPPGGSVTPILGLRSQRSFP